MASKKVRIAGGVVALLIVGGVVAFSVTKDSRSRIPVQTQKVGKHDLTSVVSASGEVKPKRFVNVSANVSGRITQLLVKEGDAVRRGDLLAVINSRELADAKSAYLEASQYVEFARVVVERRSDPDRRDGHEAPVIAEERGRDKRSLLEKLVQLASDNVAIARGLQKLQRRK